MTNILLKKFIFLSLLGHLAAFSLLSLTFGKKINNLDYQYVNFLGPFLRSADLKSQPWPITKNTGLNSVIKNEFNRLSLVKTENKEALALYYSFKPALDLSFGREKSIFMPKKELTCPIENIKDPAIMFYPPLPNHFLLYFRNRQKVHIELMFNIVSTPKAKTILLKRKVSSGNLESDLLSMRYINHYLFIQQARFPTNQWQTVKIDLAARDEK